jgi:hypothetical protein
MTSKFGNLTGRNLKRARIPRPPNALAGGPGGGYGMALPGGWVDPDQISIGDNCNDDCSDGSFGFYGPRNGAYSTTPGLRSAFGRGGPGGPGGFPGGAVAGGLGAVPGAGAMYGPGAVEYPAWLLARLAWVLTPLVGTETDALARSTAAGAMARVVLIVSCRNPIA